MNAFTFHLSVQSYIPSCCHRDGLVQTDMPSFGRELLQKGANMIYLVAWVPVGK